MFHQIHKVNYQVKCIKKSLNRYYLEDLELLKPILKKTIKIALKQEDK